MSSTQEEETGSRGDRGEHAPGLSVPIEQDGCNKSLVVDKPCLFEELIKFQRSHSIQGNEDDSLITDLIERRLERLSASTAPTHLGPRVPVGLSARSNHPSASPPNASVSFRAPLSRSAFRQRDSNSKPPIAKTQSRDSQSMH